jgi:hypothetical protein
MQALSRFHFLIPILVFSWLATPVTGHASVITADYYSIDVPPSDEDSVSPYYSCAAGFHEDARRCDYLWQAGLELLSPSPGGDSGLYADAYISRSDGGDGPYELHPRCEPALAPCFETFTPLLFEFRDLSQVFYTAVYLTSSRGGHQEFLWMPDGAHRAITFDGDLWRDLEWLLFGFYIPDDCENREDLNFRCPGETSLSYIKMTFEAETVPEPMGLLPLGLVLFGLRRRTLGPLRALRQEGPKRRSRSDDRSHAATTSAASI